MERKPDDSARPEQHDEGFAEGQEQLPDDEPVRDFAEGQEHHHHAEEDPKSDFARGQEHHDHSEEDPEGDFARGQKRGGKRDPET